MSRDSHHIKSHRKTTSRREWAGELFQVNSLHPPGWAADAADTFKQRMLSSDERFPCIFGVDATRKGTLRLAFIPTGVRRNAALARALGDFTSIAPWLGSRTSLVCLFEADPRLSTLGDYRQHFWDLLQTLHDSDTGEWPDEVDADPESESWEFAFAGTPYFVVANTPAHRLRRSRFLDCFAVTFQPRFVFDDLGEDSKQGNNARRIIRRRLASYDALPAASTLGSFGATGNREWAQYFLEEHDDPPAPESRNPIRMCPHLMKEAA